MRKIFIFSIIVVLVCLGTNGLQAQTPITAAGDTISTPGNYQVTVDTVDAKSDTSDGIMVYNTNEVNIDGNGKLLLGAGYGPDKQGLYVRTSANSRAQLNVNATNVTVEGFRHGAYWRVVTGTIDNCTFIDCEKGINFNSRQHPWISGCTASNNMFTNITKMGIEVRGPGAQILDNTFTADKELPKDGIGIAMERGWAVADGGYNTAGCLVKGNTINGGGFMKKGMVLDRSIDNTFEDNTITGCSIYGVDLIGSPTIFTTMNTLTNTDITGASGTGVHFRWASGNEFDNLTVANTDFAIVAEDGSVDNILRNSNVPDSIKVVRGSEVTLINTVYDETKFIVEDSSAIKAGYHVTFATQVNGAAVAGSIEVANNAETVVNEGVVNGAMDVVTNLFTSDAATAQGPFVVISKFNDTGEVYVSTDTVDVTSDTTFIFDLERDYSLGYLVMETAGTYTITEDTLDCTLGYDGIRVMANDVTLNGDGKVLMGAGMVTDKQGLYARTVSNDIARLNANASNFIVEGFRHGAYWRIANGTIDGNTFIECEKGINANSRQHPLITGVVMSNNVLTNISKMAIELRGPGAQMINNTISADHELDKDGIGIAIERGWPIAEGGYSTTGCLIKGNTITGNSFMKKGFMLDRSIGNLFEDNIISGCKDYGIDLMGHRTSMNQRATQNILNNTTVTCAAEDSAVGIHFVWSDQNAFDSLTVANANIGILAEGGSQGNLFTNSTITNSSTWDIMVKENSQIFVDDNTTFDPAKVSVEQGSAVFVGGFYVDLSVSLAGLLPTPGAVIVLQNNVGDTLGTGMTDILGEIQFAASPIGFSASGFSLNMNPFTIVASIMGNDGVYYAASVTATIVSDTAFTLIQTDVPEDVADMPTEFDLSQNYPNPFNPETQISYSIPAPSDVTLKIYNIHGQLINTLVDGRQSAGQKVVVWDARDQFGEGVSSGLYFYVLKAGDFKAIKRMTLLK